MDIAGKGAVVTGAGSGIGRGIALALAQAGASVVVADVESQKATAVANEIRELGRLAEPFACDVRSPEAIAALADFAWDRLGHVEILCNNAGVCLPTPGFDVSDADFQWQFDVNVRGVFNGLREFGPRFLKQGQPAWICNTGSHHSIGAPTKGVAIYVATKHAVLGLAEAFRTEFGDRIGVSVLCPGIVNTALWNAGRNRPTELGGAIAGDPRNEKAQATLGFSPERVGELVVDAIRARDFFVWTHPQDMGLIEKRYREGQDSMARQWPHGPTAEHKLTPHDVA
jgi:meso-butanediol dehydrogenase/(S,S)-butanediol dehydrogenase/diacetyl reductase